MAAYTTRACIVLTFLLICGIRCDTDTKNRDKKLSQSSEKDSKISDHEKDAGNEDIVDKTGINVNQKVPIGNVNVKHVSSSHENSQPVDAHSDQVNGKPSSNSLPQNDNDIPLNQKSPPSHLASQVDSSDNPINDDDYDEDDIKHKDDDKLLFEESGDRDESLIDQMKRLSEKIKAAQQKEKADAEMAGVLKPEIDFESVKDENLVHLEAYENMKPASDSQEFDSDNNLETQMNMRTKADSGDIKTDEEEIFDIQRKENIEADLKSTQKFNAHGQNVQEFIKEEAVEMFENIAHDNHDIKPKEVNIVDKKEKDLGQKQDIDDSVDLIKDEGTLLDHTDLKTAAEQLPVENKENNLETPSESLNKINAPVDMVEYALEELKETITEQLRNIVAKNIKDSIDKGLSSLYERDIDDEHEFPSDEELNTFQSNNEEEAPKTEYKHDDPSLKITIDNTEPPMSEILASKTQDQNNDFNKQQTLENEMYVRATPHLENIRSTVITSSQAGMTEQIKATSNVDTASTKGYLTGKERKKLRLEKSRNREDSVLDRRHGPSISKTAVPLHTVMVDSNQPKMMSEKMPVVEDENSRFSATKQDSASVETELESSEDKLTGTMYDTNALKETVLTEKHIEKNTAIAENLAPTTATEDQVLVVSETLPPQDPQQQQQQSRGEQQSSSESEESEEEKKKKAQAQQYFEEGEKLINNSYKKDHIQAYEYFKLAADLGHTKALEHLGFGYLLGDYIVLDPAKALKIFQDLSEKGAPKGQLGLGFSYSSGLAVNSSQAKALIYFTFAALGGDSLAQMVLGYRFLSGIGVESKCETALTYYRKVATTENMSLGSPVVQRIRLHEQAENKDSGAGSLMDDDLLQYYEFLADKGDVQAQVVLGQLYYQGGRGVPVNHERAHHYFSMAAESGNANALAFLGKMHSEGSPVVKQDSDLAFADFKKAAEKGNPIGQCGLGIMHLYGKGVDKDYQKALKYFTLSSDQGWSDAQLHLGIMHFGGKGVRRDYKTAVKYFNLASQGGHVLAFYHLAQMHATGTGVLRNCHTAVELYKNVAERGHWAGMLMESHELYKNGHVNEALLKYTFLAEMGYEVAQANVAYILDNGESSLFDQQETYQRALLHWTRAASQGSTVARLKMGDYHYYGYGTDIDYETAATHYRLATEQQHNAQAMFNLGYMHENGLGLKQDVHLAKRFYDMAAETSGDAYIPVTMALFKLGMFYGTEVFNKEIESYYTFFNKLDIRYQLGPYWDIYLATFLAIVLGICVVVFRQQR